MLKHRRNGRKNKKRHGNLFKRRKKEEILYFPTTFIEKSHRKTNVPCLMSVFRFYIHASNGEIQAYLHYHSFLPLHTPRIERVFAFCLPYWTNTLAFVFASTYTDTHEYTRMIRWGCGFIYSIHKHTHTYQKKCTYRNGILYLPFQLKFIVYFS